MVSEVETKAADFTDVLLGVAGHVPEGAGVLQADRVRVAVEAPEAPHQRRPQEVAQHHGGVFCGGRGPWVCALRRSKESESGRLLHGRRVLSSKTWMCSGFRYGI